MKYSPEIVDKITQLIAHDSYTIEEVCKQVGIGRTTYFRWQEEKQDFRDSIKKAKDQINQSIYHDARNSIHKLINGFTYNETTKEQRTNKTGEITSTITRTTSKVVAPNVTAVIFALKQDGWTDKQQVEHFATINFAEDDGVD